MHSRTAIVKAPDIRQAEKALSPIVRAAQMVIRTDEDYLRAGSEMKRAAAFLAGPIVQFFVKHAIDAANVHKQAVYARDSLRRRALEVKRILGEKRVGYRTRRQAAAEKIRARKEEKLRLQQIEEAKRLAKRLEKEGDKRGAKEIVKAAMEAPAPSLPAGSAVPEEEGFVQTKTYGFVIEVPEKVPAKYWVIDESLVGKDVSTFGFDADIPGVRVFEKVKEHTRKAS